VQALALLKLLEQKGLGVFCAPNGQAGVSMAKQYKPDLIILDIRMPGMDGLEACRRLKQDPRTNGIPVVLLTAHSEPEFLREGLEQGAVDFIPKDDFSEVVLLETLKQLGIIP
jgi:two-component system cell cycle response regulator